MKKEISLSFFIIPLIAFALFWSINSFGGYQDTINATITAQNISLTISATTLAYGNNALSATKSTTSGELDSTFVITNNGNVTENISGISSDATGGTTWQLAAAQGANEFTHKFSNSGGAPYSWTTFNVDNSSYTTIKSSLTSSSTTPLDLQIGVPSSSGDYVQKSITITLQASST